MKNNKEKSKTIISFVAIRIIMATISLIISIIIAKSIYNFASDINKILAIISCIIIVIFILIVVNKTITELILKMIKKNQ